MKKKYCLFSLLIAAGAICGSAQSFDVIMTEISEEVMPAFEEIDTLIYKTPQEILESLPPAEINPHMANLLFVPKVFVGYRTVHNKIDFTKLPQYNGLQVMTPAIEQADSLFIESDFIDNLEADEVANEPINFEVQTEWLKKASRMQRLQADMHYMYMVNNPDRIEYAIWDLPLPPTIYEEDLSFLKFLKDQETPEIVVANTDVEGLEVPKIHWLHKFNTGIQFSEAFISPNWYQGGNDYLSLLFNFNWNVQLNQAFHPNLLFQSDFQYKLALSSTPKGSIRKYQISDDALQYNLNAGLKAVGNWYYSFNLLFKTQLFNNFEENSWQRKASFLSPGDLNAGLGMSYNRTNKLKTFTYTLTISPLSYNLKTCIVPNDVIGHEQFNIDPNRKSKSEIGSNAEFNMTWTITNNISYKTRLFLFTDYHYFLSDWQNTFNFDINKFLSTQLFLHLRWDTSAESYGTWRKFMMREILSFGLSYTFATKS